MLLFTIINDRSDAMSFEAVKQFFVNLGLENRVMEFDTSSATVELAAKAVSVIEARIAKTLVFRNKESCIVVVTAGDAKIDNYKFTLEFKMKAKMVDIDKVFILTGHEPGGVCPFALPKDIPVYLDESMKRFQTIFPACGSDNSAVELTCDEIFNYSNAIKWVDVCKNWQ